MYTRDDRVHPGGDEAEVTGWLQHPPPYGGRGAGIWREVQYLPHRSGTLGTVPTTHYLKTVGKT